MIQNLETPYEHIRIHADTEVEKALRVTAVSKERETIFWLETMQPGETFVDIGANVGCYSLIAASRELQVIAFEPAPFNFRRLKENVALNGFQNQIKCHHDVIGDHIGTCSMQWSSTESGAASHQQIQGNDLPVTSLDCISNFTPDHIKIDVDGAELKVVQGGMKIWPEVKSVQVEIDDSLPGWEQILKILTEAGLRIVTWTRHKDTAITTSKVSNVLLRSSSP